MSQQEYISREAALRAMYAQAAECIDLGGEYAKDHDVLIAATFLLNSKSIPAADVVQVVRCKDCRFYASKQSSLCDMHNTAVNAEDYCSYGTKMDGGEHHAD